MRRRSFLATTGAALAGLAGCLNSRNTGTADRTTTAGDDPTSTPIADPTPTTESTTKEPTTTESTTTDEETETADVTVQSAHLQYGVVVPNSPDSIGISNPGTPYLVASVAVDGSLSQSDFTLDIGDDSLEPMILDRFYRTDWGDFQWYERGRPGGLLLFSLPTAESDGDVSLTWPGGKQAIDNAIRRRLGAGPPKFSAAIQVPETHESLDAPPVKIEVTNEDDVPRRFLGALNRMGPLIAYAPIERLSEMVEPGESVTVTYSDAWAGSPGDEQIGDGDPDVTYRLLHAGGETAAKIRLIEAT